MYEYIQGVLAELTATTAVVETGGIGYLLQISMQTYEALAGRSEVRLYVHQHLREDAVELYGFAAKAEREVFRLLTSVAGVAIDGAHGAVDVWRGRADEGYRRGRCRCVEKGEGNRAKNGAAHRGRFVGEGGRGAGRCGRHRAGARKQRAAGSVVGANDAGICQRPH